jgi:cation diffusion facilitator family transporter
VAATPSSRQAVNAALVGNLLVAAAKLAAAAWTGSSAMLSESVHSLVDTLNEVLLLYGLRRSAQRADAEYPLGYGRELYFWSFIVALLVFALGAGVSVYEGIRHIRNPEPITDPVVSYIVLAMAFLDEPDLAFVMPCIGDARVRSKERPSASFVWVGYHVTGHVVNSALIPFDRQRHARCARLD